MSVRTELVQTEPRKSKGDPNKLRGVDSLVVVFEPEVRNQLLSSQVSKRILQFHQLDE